MTKLYLALIVLTAVVVLENVILIIRRIRPNGLLHIDEYVNKDAYRMLYFTPLEDLKKHRRLILKVEVQKWNEVSGDFETDFMPEDYS